MNTFARPQGQALARLRERFAEAEEAQALLSAVGGRRVSASRLYAAAAADADTPDIRAVLNESVGARAFHRRTIAASAVFRLPEARAASSGVALARHGDGCRIRTERSRAEPDQFFVVVEIDKVARGAKVPTSLVVCDSDDRCSRFPLPVVRDGVAQMIAEAGSDLLRLIGDPTTRVYLR